MIRNQVATSFHSGVVLIFFLITSFASGQIHKRDSLLALNKVQTGVSKIETLIALSSWYVEADYGQAISYADEAVKLAHESDSRLYQAKAITQRAQLHWSDGEYDHSIRLNTEAIELRLEQDVDGLADNYFAIAMNYYFSADYPLAIDYFKNALDNYKLAKNRRQEAEALKRLGFIYHWMGDYPNAIPYLIDYARVRSEFDGYVGRTANLGNTSPFFRTDQYYKDELKLQLAAAEKLDMQGDKENLLLTYLNIADTYKELGEKYDALEYHKRAVKLTVEIGQTPNLNYLGNAYRAVNLVDSAILIHDKFLKESGRKRNKIDLMWTRFLLGQDYFQAGQLQVALVYYYDALAITKAMGNKLDVVINLMRIANIHIEKGEFEIAKRLCSESIMLAKKISVRPRLKDGYAQMAKIESMLGNYESAFFHMEKCKLLSDSLTAGEADLQFAKLQAQYDLDKKVSDIEKLSQEKKLQESRIRNKDQLITGFVIVILLSTWLAISIYLRFKQKSRANKILIQQKHQIETLLSEIHHRVKNNLQVISSLLSIQSDQLNDKNAKMAVLEGQSRVQAMGLIHENIYKTENFAFINMREYVTKLSESLVGSYGMQNKVRIILEIDNASVDVDTAIPLGLMINELATNSLKHAFKGISQPVIKIVMNVAADKLYVEVSDNGRGYLIPTGRESFGLRLVKELASQLAGAVHLKTDSGFTASIEIKKFKIAA